MQVARPALKRAKRPEDGPDSENTLRKAEIGVNVGQLDVALFFGGGCLY
jgi:hypothetical protein